MTALDTGLIIAATLGWLLLAVALVKVVEARDERDAAREDYESECSDHAKTAAVRDHWHEAYERLGGAYVKLSASYWTVRRERDAAHLSVEIMACESSAQRLAEMVRMGRVA